MPDTPPPPADALAPGDPPGEPVAGNVVQVDAVVPSAEANKAQGRSAIARTGIQAGVPAALLVVVGWQCQLHHVDLDPGAGTDFPSNVSAALALLLTVAAAYWMNRGRLRGEG
jgi:hypothetical protein